MQLSNERKYTKNLNPANRLIVLLDRLKEIIWDELETIEPGLRNPRPGSAKVICKDSAGVKALASLTNSFQQAERTVVDPQTPQAKQMEIAQDFLEENLPETPSKKPDIQEAIAWVNKDREIDPEEIKALARIKDGTEKEDDYLWFSHTYREPNANYEYYYGNRFAYRRYLKKEYEIGHIKFSTKYSDAADYYPPGLGNVYELYATSPSFLWTDFWENYTESHLYVNDVELLLRFYISLDEELNTAFKILSQPIDKQADIREIGKSLAETCSRLIKVLRWKVSHYQNEFQKEMLKTSWPELNLKGPFYASITGSAKYLFIAGLLGYFDGSPLADRIKKEILNSELIDINTLGFDLKEYLLLKFNTITDKKSKKDRAILEKTAPLEKKIVELSEKKQHLQLELGAQYTKVTSLEEARHSLQEQLATTITQNQARFFKVDNELTLLKQTRAKESLFKSFNTKDESVMSDLSI